MPTDVGAEDIQNLLSIAGVTDFTGHYASLGGGEINDTFILDCEAIKLILRVTKYTDVQNLPKEARALSLLDFEQVPKLVFFDESQLVHGRAWIVESYVDGEQPADLSVTQFENLGKLLAKVHNVLAEKPAQLNFWEEFLDTNKHFGDEQVFLNHPDSALKKLIQRGNDYFRSQKLDAIVPSLIHGDVSLNNMLVNNDTVSLIDWEFSRFTDPMADFSTLFYEDMAYNKGRWRIHIKEQEKSALFKGYTEAGGTISEQRLKAWHNIDKLGGATYLYWKINESGHAITAEQSKQYKEDLANLLASLEQNL